MLISVKHLVNGDTVRVDRLVVRPEYFHVELDEHHVLFAEGLPAESLVPGSDRASFDNGAAPISLHPDFHALAWDGVRGRLAERAAMLVRSPERLSA